MGKLKDKLKRLNPSNAMLGKKEDHKEEFYINCCECGKLIPLTETSCPKRIQKIIKRNYKMRGIAAIALDKMHPRCEECQKKFVARGKKLIKVSGEDMLNIAQESADEFNNANQP